MELIKYDNINYIVGDLTLWRVVSDGHLVMVEHDRKSKWNMLENVIYHGRGRSLYTKHRDSVYQLDYDVNIESNILHTIFELCVTGMDPYQAFGVIAL